MPAKSQGEGCRWGAGWGSVAAPEAAAADPKPPRRAARYRSYARHDERAAAAATKAQAWNEPPAIRCRGEGPPQQLAGPAAHARSAPVPFSQGSSLKIDRALRTSHGPVAVCVESDSPSATGGERRRGPFIAAAAQHSPAAPFCSPWFRKGGGRISGSGRESERAAWDARGRGRESRGGPRWSRADTESPAWTRCPLAPECQMISRSLFIPLQLSRPSPGSRLYFRPHVPRFKCLPRVE